VEENARGAQIKESQNTGASASLQINKEKSVRGQTKSWKSLKSITSVIKAASQTSRLATEGGLTIEPTYQLLKNPCSTRVTLFLQWMDETPHLTYEYRSETP
jgi:hypothetical protein